MTAPMLFWIVATLLALFVAATLVLPLLRAAPSDDTDPAMAIYRGQLAEVDRDLARGLLDAADAEAARTEIAHRMLDADNRLTVAPKAPEAAAPRRVSLLVGIAAAFILTFGALGLYNWLGAPGYPDIPRAQRIADSETMRNTRMSQEEAEKIAAPMMQPVPDTALTHEMRDLITRLRAAVPERPDDVIGWELLSQNEASLGNWAAAARAQERVIALKDAGTTPSDRAALADRMVNAAAGFVSPETEAQLRAILEEDEGNTTARYYFGLLYYQTDRPDVAFRFWRDLVEQGDTADPHVALAWAGVEDAAFRAGQDYTLPAAATGPTAAPGPTAADVADMAAMSPEDRAVRIEGMVAQLSDRLAREGGPVEDWAQLITALTVLGRNDEAREIWQEAAGVFGELPQARALLDQLAAERGISP